MVAGEPANQKNSDPNSSQGPFFSHKSYESYRAKIGNCTIAVSGKTYPKSTNRWVKLRAPGPPFSVCSGNGVSAKSETFDIFRPLWLAVLLGPRGDKGGLRHHHWCLLTPCSCLLQHHQSGLLCCHSLGRPPSLPAQASLPGCFLLLLKHTPCALRTLTSGICVQLMAIAEQSMPS